MRFIPDSDQMIWDWSAEYFAHQKRRCMTPSGGCRYLMGDKRCVIGNMFEVQNRNDWHFLTQYFGPVKGLIEALRPFLHELEDMNDRTVELLTEIQHVHDRTDCWSTDDTGLNQIGVNLFMEIPDRFGLSKEYASKWSE